MEEGAMSEPEPETCDAAIAGVEHVHTDRECPGPGDN
jgi:hypothetical protein